MDKSFRSSAHSTPPPPPPATTPTSSNSSSTAYGNRDHYLRQLNKISQKISKPIIKKPTFDSSSFSSSQNHQQNHTFSSHNRLQPKTQVHVHVQVQAQAQAQAQAHQQLQNLQQQQQQPPVYNINKNDFKDVVQKLTGSPAHDRISTPPPIHQPKPPSSRLHRIRPPPLAHIANRPPPPLNAAMPHPPPPANNAYPAIPSDNPINAVSVNNFCGFGRPAAAPLSPLPPFPTVHAAVESPISQFMRRLQNSTFSIDSNSDEFSGFSPLAPLVSPHRNNFAPQQPRPEPLPNQGMVPSQTSASESQVLMPSSPVPFGCLNSPMSSYYPLLSPTVLFSPSSGQLLFPQLPFSPTVPVLSPGWKGL